MGHVRGTLVSTELLPFCLPFENPTRTTDITSFMVAVAGQGAVGQSHIMYATG